MTTRFIADMTSDAGHAANVRSIVELGHNLGFHVIGEGIETDEILVGLAATGCDLAQGYLFARPMPLEQLAAWLGDLNPLAPTSGSLS
jgi:EAL domain-containing protein (putative c-di-GMP-specific phosphodiesterase class I)